MTSTTTERPVKSAAAKKPVSSKGSTTPVESKTKARSLTSAATSTSKTICANQIADKAYQIWQTKGCTHGSDVQDWLEAEQLLQEASV